MCTFILHSNGAAVEPSVEVSVDVLVVFSVVVVDNVDGSVVGVTGDVVHISSVGSIPVSSTVQPSLRASLIFFKTGFFISSQQ